MALQHLKPTEVTHLSKRAEAADAPRHVALVKTSQFEAIHLSLKAGETIPALKVQGYATVQCLRGSVELAMDDHSVTMSSGDWLYLDRGQQHAVHSHEDSALLVTIMLGK